LRAVGVVRSPALLGAVGKLVSFVYDHSDLILASSRSFLAEIAKYSSHDRVAYFPNWSEAIFDADATPAEEVPARDGKFNVMFAGNIGDAQDFPTILRAAELLRSSRHIRWLIVGDGRMASWVRQEIANRALSDSVLMLGKHPVERMPSFFRHADALLVSLKDQPIFAMTVPGKLQSYMAAGIPIVGMLNGEGADTIRRAGAGLVCAAGDADGLAKVVVELASAPAERLSQMRSCARTYNAQEFDRDKRITQLEEWLLQLSEGGAPPRRVA
jgi:glycosyltransferase involved in cell wall biosynthesis